jgi:hypothetical protein
MMRDAITDFSTTVGNPNTEQEEGGQNMPPLDEESRQYEDVQVNATPALREELFSQLDMRSALMRGLDEQTWLRHLEMLRTASTGTFSNPVLVGGLEISSVRVDINGYRVNVDVLDQETIERFVKAASNGRMLVSDSADMDYAGGLRLRPISNLEDQAWKMSGMVHYMFPEIYDGVSLYSVSDLRRAMGAYRDFRINYRRRYLQQVIRNNMRADAVARRELDDFTQERIDRFQNFIYKVKGNLLIEADPFSHLTILPPKTLSSRRWGIEIEAVDINGVDTPKYWDLHGDGSLRSLSYEGRYDHDDDCDVYVEDPDCDCGECRLPCDCGFDDEGGYDETSTGEWNSPVLRSFHSRGLKYLCEQLEHRPTNSTPGIHVHVEADDLSPEQAARLSVIYSALEPLFDREYHRREREYCRSVDLPEIIKRFRESRRIKRAGGRSRDMSFNSRYWTVNLAALNQHGTVEFRAMGPKYNYEHLIRWAHFCREMVNIAKADVPQKEWASIRTFKDLIVLFSKYGKETPTPEWAGNLPAKDVLTLLGSENRREPNMREHENSIEDVFEGYWAPYPRLEEAIPIW